MDQKSMTAMASAFARWYHAEHNGVKIFDDTLAGQILSPEEKERIAAAMSGGIGFFRPAFRGTDAEALRWVVDHQLSPPPLGRAAFAERVPDEITAQYFAQCNRANPRHSMSAFDNVNYCLARRF